jgi:hypothetical protein
MLTCRPRVGGEKYREQLTKRSPTGGLPEPTMANTRKIEIGFHGEQDEVL